MLPDVSPVPLAQWLLPEPTGDPVVRRLLEVIETHSALLPPAGWLAHELGFPSRYALARYLRARRFPCASDLARWARVAAWMRRWEAEHLSLSQQALHEGRDPAVYYRLVRRITGQSWSALARSGSRTVRQAFTVAIRGSES
jgi:hypothetical protein